MGRYGHEFDLLKFRTMVEGADRMGPPVTAAADPRITTVGRFLRRTKLDELPQLWNVIRGEMAIVGPRPEDPSMVARYNENQRTILSYRPGMTSPASIAYRDEEHHLQRLLSAGQSFDDAYQVIMCDKLRIDLDYFAHRTLRNDAVVIAQTLRSVLRPSTERVS